MDVQLDRQGVLHASNADADAAGLISDLAGMTSAAAIALPELQMMPMVGPYARASRQVAMATLMREVRPRVAEDMRSIRYVPFRSHVTASKHLCNRKIEMKCFRASVVVLRAWSAACFPACSV
jgi:hypothetical protein